MENNTRIKRIRDTFVPFLPILIVLILGAFLRLYQIDKYMTFLGDEGRDVLIVKRIIVDGKWTLLGPTASVGGFFMGPIYYYFMLPFLWLFRLDPVGPAVMVALFGVATIYLLYIFAATLFTKRTAIIASVLYALSPLVISYARSSWNPNVVPFFALLMMYLLWQSKGKQNLWWVFGVGLCAGIGVQLHYTYLFLLPVVFIWMIINVTKAEDIRRYLVVLGGFLVGFSPFLAFEFRHGFTNTKAIVDFIFAGKDTGFDTNHFLSNISDIYFRLFGRLLLRIPEKGTLGNMYSPVRDSWIAGTWALAAVSGGIIVKRFFQKVQKKLSHKKAESLLFLLWIIVPLLCFGIYKKSVYDYYLGFMYPVPFIWVGYLIDTAMQKNILYRITGGLLLVFLVIFNWEGRPFKYQPNNQLGQVKLIAREVLAKTDNKPYNFALITAGNSDHGYRYFFELWGRPPVVIENDAVDPDRNTVTDQLMVVCEDVFCEPLGNSLWEVAGFGRAEIAGEWGVSVVKIYKLVHYYGKE